VSKAPLLANVGEISTTIGSGSTLRLTGDFNVKTSETSAFRLNAMTNTADNWGNFIDKVGVARAFRSPTSCTRIRSTAATTSPASRAPSTRR
jgi:catecholate siderophore receptor